MKRCAILGKVQYADKEKAEFVAWSIGELKVYKCICGSWHLTKGKKGTRKKYKQMGDV